MLRVLCSIFSAAVLLEVFWYEGMVPEQNYDCFRNIYSVFPELYTKLFTKIQNTKNGFCFTWKYQKLVKENIPKDFFSSICTLKDLY